MVQFNEIKSTVADNTVVLNGQIEYKLTDAEITKLNDIIKGIVSSRNNNKVESSEKQLVFEDEKPSKGVSIVGKKVWQEDFCTVTLVDGAYRLYITCPVKGEKGEKIRYAIKASAKKDFGAKFGGNFNNGEIYWIFPNEDSAKKYINSRMEYAQKVASK